MASTEHPEPEPEPETESGGRSDEPATGGEADVETAVNAFLDAQMGPEPTDEVETVDATTPPDDMGLAEWAERVKETQYGLG